MWLMALGCGILLSSSGCCGFLRNGSCGQGSGYESCGRSYGDCGPTCGPVDRPYRQRIYGNNGGGCNACGDECGSSCQSNFCFHPFQWIGKLFYAGTWCGPSCRNTYWGEVVSDPPACREPCNCNGQYTGRSGCASCNRGAAMQESGDMSPYPTGTMLPDDPEPIPAPQTPTKAMRRPAADSYDR
jgi:hypothetical protein